MKHRSIFVIRPQSFRNHHHYGSDVLRADLSPW